MKQKGKNIRFVLAFLIMIFTNFLSSQDKKCDCLVRYGFQYDAKRKVDKFEEPFIPKKGQKFAYHLVVNDSLGKLYYIPHVYDSIIHQLYL